MSNNTVDYKNDICRCKIIGFCLINDWWICTKCNKMCSKEQAEKWYNKPPTSNLINRCKHGIINAKCRYCSS